jgi:hypothetical protein
VSKKFKLNKDEISLVRKYARERYRSNRKAKNPTQKMIESPCDYHSDIIGLIGEFAVAKYFDIPLDEIQWVYDQDEFSHNKHNIFDIAQCEVRSTPHDVTGRLNCKHSDLRHKTNTPFILVRVTYNPINFIAIGNVIGWAYPTEVVTPENEKTYHTTSYYLPNHLLNPLETLPETKKKAS